MSRRLLITARDPGAVGHIEAIVLRLRKESDLEIYLATSGPAHTRLRQSLGDHPEFILPNGSSHIDPNTSPEALLDATARLLERIRPNAVLTSISSYGAGIDEAVAALFNGPSFTFQDFWGDANPRLGHFADTYFVLDDFAAKLTQKRWGIEDCVVTGPVKYSLYEQLDPSVMRQAAREKIGVDHNASLVGWFGQSPSIPGHRQLLHTLVNVLTEQNPSPTLLLRQHPKFQQDKQQTIDYAGQAGLTVFDTTSSLETELWLSACDLVVTPFSLCGLDHSHLSRHSTRPLGSLIYLMTEPSTLKFMQKVTGLDALPPAKQGIGHWLLDKAQLPGLLSDSLSEKTARNYYEQTKQLVSPNLEIIATRICSSLSS
ncbi:hypothetical protein [Desulfovibrio ferrophilus]|uniref:Uncharacterized protein n=1 Tax=Desulfovibrio ferrophilus TaxID=241368 RepID=A0A2Z6B1G9_9BACT|nr:hypothetical protein [Desulfovibrio ferrophilus]BBD09321.1 uncharacterized protein DFE_2595 [Desulfovibrio ferrophilus]